MRTIPFFSLARQWSNLQHVIRPELETVLSSQQYINGSATAAFEKNLAAHVGASFAVGCNSGTDALWLALKTLNLKENELVLTTPFSFIASSSEIVALGGIPVFIDVDRATYNLSAENLKNWLDTHAQKTAQGTVHSKTNQKIVGILTVNIFGQCVDYARIRALANEWGLWIVEDAAQSIGSSTTEGFAGTLGDISCFSFYPTKNLGACGDAGAATTNREDLHKEMVKLRNHGRLGHYEYQCMGKNSRLDSLQAAVLNAKLPLLKALNARRRSIAAHYTKRLGSCSFMQLPTEVMGEHTYHQYCVTVPEALRDSMRNYLAQEGVGTNIFYPADFTTIPFLNPDERLRTACPVAHELTKTIIALPIWPELLDEEVSYICDKIEAFSAQQLHSTTTSRMVQPQ